MGRYTIKFFVGKDQEKMGELVCRRGYIHRNSHISADEKEFLSSEVESQRTLGSKKVADRYTVCGGFELVGIGGRYEGF